jgi:CRISPR-associated protein Cmr5
MPPTTEQNRASHAYESIKHALLLKHEDRNHYGIHAKKMPVRIISAGLGQALAFVLDKKNANELVKDLSDWVLNKTAKYNPTSRPDQKLLIENIINGDAEKLRYYTHEALAYLQWLNRFASAQSLKVE